MKRELQDFKVPEQSCPSCAHTLNAALESQADGRAPTPGDLTFCIHCNELLRYGKGLLLRKVSAKEERKLVPSERATVNATRRLLERFRKHRTSVQ